MAYTKNNWAVYNPNLPDDEQDDAFITKAKLDNIESGIEKAHELVESATGESTTLEIGEVTEGETAAAEIVDGKLNLTLPKGEAGADGKDGEPGEKGDTGEKGEQGEKGKTGENGKDGYTPVKGTDYFTEEDKEEIKNAVLDSFETAPYYLEEHNKVFACGTHIDVFKADEDGKLRITWTENGASKEMIVPEDVGIFGGGFGKDRYVYYPSTSITLHSGHVGLFAGGNYGNGSVGHAIVVINGGTFRSGNGPCTGGVSYHEGNCHDNKVGLGELIINNTDSEFYGAFGGTCSGLGTVGHSIVVINGGSVRYGIAGGSNGHTTFGEIVVNGGTVKVLQGCNRGTVDHIKMTVNGGTVNNLYAGGETGDSSVNATYDKAEVFINGIVANISAGTDGGVESASKVSGKYVDGVVDDSAAAAMNLVKTITADKLLEKLTEASIL